MTQQIQPLLEQRSDLKRELKRMFSMALFSGALLGLSVILDSPVSILGWILFGTGYLCLLYILVASRLLSNRLPSQSDSEKQ